MFDTFTPPPPRELGDTFRARDNVNKALIVKVTKTAVHEQTTQGRGGEAVYVDVVDLADEQVYHDVMWMAGAVVDALKPYVGAKPVVISLAMVPNKTRTREYLSVVQATEEQLKAAKEFVAKNGDPFAVQLTTVDSPGPVTRPWRDDAA
jgi:hypothetical protein